VGKVQDQKKIRYRKRPGWKKENGANEVWRTPDATIAPAGRNRKRTERFTSRSSPARKA